MSKDLIEINYRQELVGIRTYKTKYIAEITHRGLNEYKLLTSDDRSILQSKVNSHVAKLEEKWSKIVFKENIVRSKEASLKEAEAKTQEAITKLKQIDNLLLHTLDIDDTVDWEQLKDKTKFKIPSPEKELNKLLSLVTKPVEPVFLAHPNKPNSADYQPQLSFFDKLIKSKRQAKIQQSNALLEQALNDWRINCKNIDRDNQNIMEQYQIALSNYEKQIETVKETNAKEIKIWEKSKADFIVNQEQTNAKVEILKAEYMKLDTSSVLEYCDLVLNNSEYPENFPKSFELETVKYFV